MAASLPLSYPGSGLPLQKDPTATGNLDNREEREGAREGRKKEKEWTKKRRGSQRKTEKNRRKVNSKDKKRTRTSRRKGRIDGAKRKAGPFHAQCGRILHSQAKEVSAA